VVAAVRVPGAPATGAGAARLAGGGYQLGFGSSSAN